MPTSSPLRSPSAAQVPCAQDGASAANSTLKDLRGMRYMEFFLVGSEPLDGQIKGTCYNTTGQNLSGGGRDTCPQDVVEKVDPVALATEYGVARVVLNPPRQWLLDWIDIETGAVRQFGPLKATWCAVMNMPKGEWQPYTTTTIARKSAFGFSRGKPIYLLDDPEGNIWVMKSVSPAVNPENTFERIGEIGTRLGVPEGWRFRTRVLEEDLILIPESGVARILRDDLFDVYDLTGKGYSNFNP